MGQYLRLFPTALVLLSAVVTVIAVLVARVLDRRRGTHRTWSHTIGGAIALFGLLMTLAITLMPPIGGPTSPRSLDLGMSSPSRPQTVINLALLWWVAIALPLARRSGVLATTATALAVSVGIETVQVLLGGGRSAAVLDVVLNTAGALGMAALTVAALRAPRRRAGRTTGAGGTSGATPASAPRSG